MPGQATVGAKTIEPIKDRIDGSMRLGVQNSKSIIHNSTLSLLKPLRYLAQFVQLFQLFLVTPAGIVEADDKPVH